VKIGIDLDGVLVNFNNDYARLITELNPDISFPVNDPNWPPCWHYERAAGLTKAQESEVWRIITAPTSLFWQHLPEYPETREACLLLQEMRLQGHELYFITSRPGRTAKVQTERWLMSKGLISPTVLVVSQMSLKAPLEEGLELDAFIDDKPENCDDAVKARPEAAVFMPDRPYNRESNNPGVVRVKNIVEALRLLWRAEEEAA
jgi:uncharacterized HAD superfamily protein